MGARELVAANRFLRLERETGSTTEGALDFNTRCGLLSVVVDFSRGVLPFKISLSLSGSSSKSTEFFGASTGSVVTPDTTRGLGVTFSIGESAGQFGPGELDPELLNESLDFLFDAFAVWGSGVSSH